MFEQFLWSFGLSLLVTQAAIFSTTIFLHRTVTHNALRLHPIASVGFRFCLWITTGLSTREWVAVHRKHHTFTDEEGDPHSPRLMGFWSVQLGNVFHYVKEARNQETLERFARDVKDDVFDRTLFQHKMLGPPVGIFALCYLLGFWWGLAAAALHLVLYVFVLSSSINGLCHYIGYRNYPDNSATNIRWLAWITGGEGLHNNHHAHPTSPKFSWKRREFDPAWPVIKLLMFCGLASER